MKGQLITDIKGQHFYCITALFSFVPYVLTPSGREEMICSWVKREDGLPSILITRCTALHVVRVSVYTLMKHRQVGRLQPSLWQIVCCLIHAAFQKIFYSHNNFFHDSNITIYFLSGKKLVAYLPIRTQYKQTMKKNILSTSNWLCHSAVKCIHRLYTSCRLSLCGKWSEYCWSWCRHVIDTALSNSAPWLHRRTAVHVETSY